MKGQIISYKKKNEKWSLFTFSSHNSPETLDTFNVNIVDLRDGTLWEYNNANNNGINSINDFRSLKKILENSSVAINIIVLPGNMTYSCSWNKFTNKFDKQIQIKDMLSNFSNYMLSELIPNGMPVDLVYENSITTVSEYDYKAAFYFIEDNFKAKGIRALTRANGNNKATTISISDRLFITTADFLDSEEQLKNYLQGIGICSKDTVEYPEWLLNYEFADDAAQNEAIIDCKERINNAKCEISRAQDKLNANLKYKSILFTNGDNLVSVVFEILEKILDCDLSQFIDEKKEDFLIKLSDITFIGEIKGVTSNVKSEHVSQIEVHYQGYMDNLQENNISEQVKQLLIINPFRTKPIDERDPVHKIQIKLAERNGSLIIETKTLLQIFEGFQKGIVSTEKIKQVFIKKTGLLDLSNFN